MQKTITPQEFTSLIELIGLKVDNKLSFNYLNNLNENTYKARSINVVSKETGRSWAHCDEVSNNPTRTEQYQAIRRHYTVKNGATEWEI